MSKLINSPNPIHNRWNCFLTAAAFTVGFGVSDVNFDDSEIQPHLSDAARSYQLVENSLPTGSTKFYKEFREDDSSFFLEDQLAWVDQEITQLFDSLDGGISPEYSDDLLTLAETLLATNPEAQRFFS